MEFAVGELSRFFVFSMSFHLAIDGIAISPPPLVPFPGVPEWLWGRVCFVSLQWGNYRVFLVFNMSFHLAIDGLRPALPPLVPCPGVPEWLSGRVFVLVCNGGTVAFFVFSMSFHVAIDGEPRAEIAECSPSYIIFKKNVFGVALPPRFLGQN